MMSLYEKALLENGRVCWSAKRRLFAGLLCPAGLIGRFGLAALLALLTLYATPAAHAAPPRSAIVLDGYTGAVLSRENSSQKRYPASLTKMMTIYLLLEKIESGKMTLNTKMTVSARASARPASKLYLKPGEKISASLALSALIVRSANDVATVVAEHIGGSEEAFAKLMTRRARALGMLDTTFKNASGLYDWGQVSTAHDMGRLAHALLRDFPDYKHIWSQTSMSYRGQTYRSHNRLLTRLAGAIGMKTGYIRASGYNIVGVAERDGKRVITVVIGGRSSKDRDRKAISLTDRNMARASTRNVRYRQMTPEPRPFFEAKAATFIKESSQTDLAITNKLANKLTNTLDNKADHTVLSERIAASASVSSNTQARNGDNKASACPSVSESGQNGWAVQLGAFYEQKEAEARVSEVLTKNIYTQYARQAQPTTSLIECNGHRLYRARLAGLTQKSAQALCSSLRKSNADCFTVSP